MEKSVKEFQSERLEMFAGYLASLQEIQSNTFAISDSESLWMVDGKLTGSVDFFYGPLICLPEIFPDEWYESNGVISLKDSPNESTLANVMDFFSLTFQQVGHLFIPKCQKPMLYGGTILTVNAKPIHFANNIYSLVESQKVMFSFISLVNENYSKN